MTEGCAGPKALPDRSLVPTAEGIAIAVHDFGGAGPAVVFAHATGFHGLVLQALAGRLTDVFHCISFDHRGHGDSGVPAGLDFAWAGLGRDVLSVVDGMGLDRPFAVGHSSGATAILSAEASRPGTFRALYCFEPIVIPADPPLGYDAANWLAASARRRRDSFGSRQEVLASYSTKAPFATWAPEVLAAYVDHGFEEQTDGTVRLKCRPENEARVYEMATAHDAYAKLPDVRCPVMLAHGSESEAIRPDGIQAIAHRFPDHHIETLAGLGHLGPLEDPVALERSIRRFLDSQLSGGWDGEQRGGD